MYIGGNGMGRFIANAFSKVLPFGMIYVKASKRGLHVPGLYVPESEADGRAVMRHRYMEGSESQIDHLLSSAFFVI